MGRWDNKNPIRRGKLPFSAKVLIGVGILVILITYLIAFSTAPAYASDNKCEVDYAMWYKHSQILCWVISIHEQNEQIIEKLDWNNCVMIWKEDLQTYDNLVNACGEIP